MTNGKVTCPHADKDGVRERAELNHKKMYPNSGRGERGERVRRKPPSWMDFAKNTKRKFTKALLADPEALENFETHMAHRKKEADDHESKMSRYGPKRDKERESVVMGFFPVYNINPGAKPLLPIKLDTHMPHIDIEFGTQGEDNLVTRVASLVDTGAGCTTGNLRFFQAAIAMNPSIVVEIYTSKNGEYSPITMHGIVDPNAQGGTHTTELPVCFRLRTTYTLRDGKELHLLVACGMDVAVNFIIGNSWFKQIGAVIDYGGNCLRVPNHEDLKRFPLNYHQPKCVAPEIGSGSLHAHWAAYRSLPTMANMVQIITLFDNKSPYLQYYTKLVDTLKQSTLAAVPEAIVIDGPKVPGDRGVGPGPNNKGSPQVDSNGGDKGDKESADHDVVPQASTNAIFVSQLGKELCTHAHGQAGVVATLCSSESEDLFESSDEEESPVE